MFIQEFPASDATLCKTFKAVIGGLAQDKVGYIKFNLLNPNRSKLTLHKSFLKENNF